MLPFVGFGFLDNFLMLSFGEVIEANLATKFAISTMTCAAIGNIFADGMSVGFSDLIERIISK
jgi:hypothetical protein